MNFFRKIFKYLIGRYSKVQLIIIAIVIVFGFMIGESSIFSRISYDAQIMDLKSQIKHYQTKTADDKQKLEEINDDKERVEKFARETYRMKHDNEDLFIVE